MLFFYLGFLILLPILQAALWDNVELLVDLLQEEQHLIECQDNFGRTPIHAAAVTANSNCLQLLINARANVDAQAMDGKVRKLQDAFARLDNDLSCLPDCSSLER